jgi:hypothetical protein
MAPAWQACVAWEEMSSMHDFPLHAWAAGSRDQIRFEKVGFRKALRASMATYSSWFGLPGHKIIKRKNGK